MNKKSFRAALAGLLLLLLSGCVSWSAEDSYRLPNPPAEYENLMSAVAQTRRELAAATGATVEDVAPASGANTAPVQLLDMDGDGRQETAVTFLRAVGAPQPIRICFYDLQPDGSWRPSAVIMGEGDGVSSIRYADVDGLTGPDPEQSEREIVVGWQMGSNATYLGVYALDGDEAVELAAAACDAFTLADLDQNGVFELAVCHLDGEGQTGRVDVYAWNESRVCRVTSAPLSAGVTAVSQLGLRYLESMTPALCLTLTLADESRTVDLIVKRQGEAVNLTLDPETGVSRERTEGYGEALTSDVNGDGASEIARPRRLPAREGAAEAWVLDWVQYSASGRVTPVCTTYHNAADGWYLILPDEWRDVLSVHRSDTVPGQRSVVFSRRTGEGEPQPFLTVSKLTGSNRSLRAVAGGRFILAEDSSTIYAAAFQGTWDCGLDESGVLANFRLIAGGWSGE